MGLSERLVLSKANVAIRAERIHLKHRVGPITDMRAKERILTNASLIDATRPIPGDVVFRLSEHKMFAGLSLKAGEGR